MLLKKNTVQLIFEGYTFNEDMQKEEDNQTTSSEFYKKKEKIQILDIWLIFWLLSSDLHWDTAPKSTETSNL